MLKTFWENFKSVMRAIGNFQARVFLSLLYLALVLPTGALLRLFADPLDLQAPNQAGAHEPVTFWKPREPLNETLDGARLQS